MRFRIGGKNRIYAYRECEFDEIAVHSGMYFGTLERDGLRLSLDGSFIVGSSAKKNVVELDDTSAFKWLTGRDVEAEVTGYCILKWKERGYILGCGKGNGKLIRNFVPKDRRIKK
ncbi:methyltransferase RsmF C-terminal domain-like protein [Archaeoglobus neptunius]|uniref:methyltransferase RsmF C-terminal domain-like protein n=1 Tax=Archaeoglobus neptunius TaxID=2798580 RepID=UPI001E64D680|nr:hypothetical protein [Archaeoglobus neptunius]